MHLGETASENIGLATTKITKPLVEDGMRRPNNGNAESIQTLSTRLHLNGITNGLETLPMKTATAPLMTRRQLGFRFTKRYPKAHL